LVQISFKSFLQFYNIAITTNGGIIYFGRNVYGFASYRIFELKQQNAALIAKNC
jgi:hypothetical protein